MAGRPKNAMKHWFKNVSDIPGPFHWKVPFENDLGMVIVTEAVEGHDIVVTLQHKNNSFPYGLSQRCLYFRVCGSSMEDKKLQDTLLLYNLNTTISMFVKELEQ